MRNMRKQALPEISRACIMGRWGGARAAPRRAWQRRPGRAWIPQGRSRRRGRFAAGCGAAGRMRAHLSGARGKGSSSASTARAG